MVASRFKSTPPPCSTKNKKNEREQKKQSIYYFIQCGIYYNTYYIINEFGNLIELKTHAHRIMCTLHIPVHFQPTDIMCGSHSHTNKNNIKNFKYKPDVLSPGLAVNLATSTIFTANCIFDSRCMHLRTIENGPLLKFNVQ